MNSLFKISLAAFVALVVSGCSKGGELVLEPGAVITPPGALDQVSYVKATDGGGFVYEVGPPAGTGHKSRIFIKQNEQKAIQGGGYKALLSRAGG